MMMRLRLVGQTPGWRSGWVLGGRWGEPAWGLAGVGGGLAVRRAEGTRGWILGLESPPQVRLLCKNGLMDQMVKRTIVTQQYNHYLE